MVRKVYKLFRTGYTWDTNMSHETFVFKARLTHVAGRKIGVYAPKEYEYMLEKHLGKEVVVIIYVPKKP